MAVSAWACGAQQPGPVQGYDLRGVEVFLPLFDSIAVRLEDGRGSSTTAHGEAILAVGLTEWLVTGDLDGDDRDEVVTVLWDVTRRFVLSGDSVIRLDGGLTGA
jgi:hypothetical protein